VSTEAVGRVVSRILVDQVPIDGGDIAACGGVGADGQAVRISIENRQGPWRVAIRH
jgi:hypothetical protein